MTGVRVCPVTRIDFHFIFIFIWWLTIWVTPNWARMMTLLLAQPTFCCYYFLCMTQQPTVSYNIYSSFAIFLLQKSCTIVLFTWISANLYYPLLGLVPINVGNFWTAIEGQLKPYYQRIFSPAVSAASLLYIFLPKIMLDILCTPGPLLFYFMKFPKKLLQITYSRYLKLKKFQIALIFCSEGWKHTLRLICNKIFRGNAADRAGENILWW